MIGRSPLRREDERMLRGAGRFIEDISLDGMLHAVVRRSDYAHARLLAIDAEAAPS
jgi:carbon-monoxide dehydrogenase large subunit